MLVEERQGSLGLLHSDEFLCAFAGGQLATMQSWRLGTAATDRVFSGLLCGGGAMLGRLGVADPSAVSL